MKSSPNKMANNSCSMSQLLFSVDYILSIYSDRYILDRTVIRGNIDAYSIIEYKNYVTWDFTDALTKYTVVYFKRTYNAYIISDTQNITNHVVYRHKLMLFTPMLSYYRIYPKNYKGAKYKTSTNDLKYDPVENVALALREFDVDRIEIGKRVYTKNMMRSFDGFWDVIICITEPDD